MDDIVIDHGVLLESAGVMRTISAEFTDAARVRELLEWSFGSGEVAEAMADFTGNWDRHRRLLVEGLSGLADQTEAVSAGFAELDVESKLSNSTRPAAALGGVR
jgi:hypothetical protein